MGTWKKLSSRFRRTKPSSSPASEPTEAEVVARYFALFERAKYQIFVAPFHGATIPVMVRELTQAQILACGDFSVIETLKDKIARKDRQYSASESLEFAEIYHAIVEAALVHPTYDELVTVLGRDPRAGDFRARAEAIRGRLRDITPSDPERVRLEEQLDSNRIWIDLILPDDFLKAVFNYTMGVERSGIKLVNENMLINAAQLAELGHNNPADHLQGPWKDLPSAAFYIDDINARAWIALHNKREEDKRAQEKPNGR